MGGEGCGVVLDSSSCRGNSRGGCDCAPFAKLFVRCLQVHLCMHMLLQLWWCLLRSEEVMLDANASGPSKPWADRNRCVGCSCLAARWAERGSGATSNQADAAAAGLSEEDLLHACIP